MSPERLCVSVLGRAMGSPMSSRFGFSSPAEQRRRLLDTVQRGASGTDSPYRVATPDLHRYSFILQCGASGIGQCDQSSSWRLHRIYGSGHGISPLTDAATIIIVHFSKYRAAIILHLLLRIGGESRGPNHDVPYDARPLICVTGKVHKPRAGKFTAGTRSEPPCVTIPEKCGESRQEIRRTSNPVDPCAHEPETKPIC